MFFHPPVLCINSSFCISQKSLQANAQTYCKLGDFFCNFIFLNLDASITLFSNVILHNVHETGEVKSRPVCLLSLSHSVLLSQCLSVSRCQTKSSSLFPHSLLSSLFITLTLFLPHTASVSLYLKPRIGPVVFSTNHALPRASK